MDTEKLFRRLIALAKQSEHKFQMSAAIIDKNSILGLGINDGGTHTQSPHPYKTIHAEFAAIHKALATRKNLRGASLFVLRVTKGGKVGTSSPCKSCRTLIESVGIKTIYYITEERIFAKEKI